ncbi:MAG: hypothetical protein CSA81_08430 [Acidobacteria bacterium]|nr:MAG: hypothetical protein CSA81_08430 [Acidobacteriota bacterium]
MDLDKEIERLTSVRFLLTEPFQLKTPLPFWKCTRISICRHHLGWRIFMGLQYKTPLQLDGAFPGRIGTGDDMVQ